MLAYTRNELAVVHSIVYISIVAILVGLREPIFFRKLVVLINPRVWECPQVSLSQVCSRLLFK